MKMVEFKYNKYKEDSVVIGILVNKELAHKVELNKNPNGEEIDIIADGIIECIKGLHKERVVATIKAITKVVF